MSLDHGASTGRRSQRGVRQKPTSATSAAEQRDKLASPHSITSSASASSLSGTVIPAARWRASDGASERHQGATLLGGEAIEQPVAAGAAQVGLATAAVGPARGMR
jgi:hypothetical protein